MGPSKIVFWKSDRLDWATDSEFVGITGEMCTEVSVISVWGISEALGLISVFGGPRGRLLREPAIDSWSFKLELSKELSWGFSSSKQSKRFDS